MASTAKLDLANPAKSGCHRLIARDTVVLSFLRIHRQDRDAQIECTCCSWHPSGIYMVGQGVDEVGDGAGAVLECRRVCQAVHFLS